MSDIDELYGDKGDIDVIPDDYEENMGMGDESDQEFDEDQYEEPDNDEEVQAEVVVDKPEQLIDIERYRLQEKELYSQLSRKNENGKPLLTWPEYLKKISEIQRKKAYVELEISDLSSKEISKRKNNIKEYIETIPEAISIIKELGGTREQYRALNDQIRNELDTIVREREEKAKNVKNVREFSWLDDQEYSGMIKKGSEVSVEVDPDTLYFSFEISSDDHDFKKILFPGGTLFKVNDFYQNEPNLEVDTLTILYPLPVDDPAYGKKKKKSSEDKIPEVIKYLANMSVSFPDMKDVPVDIKEAEEAAAQLEQLQEDYIEKNPHGPKGIILDLKTYLRNYIMIFANLMNKKASAAYRLGLTDNRYLSSHVKAIFNEILNELENNDNANDLEKELSKLEDIFYKKAEEYESRDVKLYSSEDLPIVEGGTRFPSDIKELHSLYKKLQGVGSYVGENRLVRKFRESQLEDDFRKGYDFVMQKYSKYRYTYNLSFPDFPLKKTAGKVDASETSVSLGKTYIPKLPGYTREEMQELLAFNKNSKKLVQVFRELVSDNKEFEKSLKSILLDCAKEFPFEGKEDENVENVLDAIMKDVEREREMDFINLLYTNAIPIYEFIENLSYEGYKKAAGSFVKDNQDVVDQIYDGADDNGNISFNVGDYVYIKNPGYISKKAIKNRIIDLKKLISEIKNEIEIIKGILGLELGAAGPKKDLDIDDKLRLNLSIVNLNDLYQKYYGSDVNLEFNENTNEGRLVFPDDSHLGIFEAIREMEKNKIIEEGRSKNLFQIKEEFIKASVIQDVDEDNQVMVKIFDSSPSVQFDILRVDVNNIKPIPGKKKNGISEQRLIKKSDRLVSIPEPIYSVKTAFRKKRKIVDWVNKVNKENENKNVTNSVTRNVTNSVTRNVTNSVTRNVSYGVPNKELRSIFTKASVYWYNSLFKEKAELGSNDAILLGGYEIPLETIIKKGTEKYNKKKHKENYISPPPDTRIIEYKDPPIFDEDVIFNGLRKIGQVEEDLNEIDYFWNNPQEYGYEYKLSIPFKITANPNKLWDKLQNSLYSSFKSALKNTKTNLFFTLTNTEKVAKKYKRLFGKDMDSDGKFGPTFKVLSVENKVRDSVLIKIDGKEYRILEVHSPGNVGIGWILSGSPDVVFTDFEEYLVAVQEKLVKKFKKFPSESVLKKIHRISEYIGSDLYMDLEIEKPKKEKESKKEIERKSVVLNLGNCMKDNSLVDPDQLLEKAEEIEAHLFTLYLNTESNSYTYREKAERICLIFKNKPEIIDELFSGENQMTVAELISLKFSDASIEVLRRKSEKLSLKKLLKWSPETPALDEEIKDAERLEKKEKKKDKERKKRIRKSSREKYPKQWKRMKKWNIEIPSQPTTIDILRGIIETEKIIDYKTIEEYQEMTGRKLNFMRSKQLLKDILVGRKWAEALKIANKRLETIKKMENKERAKFFKQNVKKHLEYVKLEIENPLDTSKVPYKVRESFVNDIKNTVDKVCDPRTKVLFRMKTGMEFNPDKIGQVIEETCFSITENEKEYKNVLQMILKPTDKHEFCQTALSAQKGTIDIVTRIMEMYIKGEKLAKKGKKDDKDFLKELILSSSIPLLKALQSVELVRNAIDYYEESPSEEKRERNTNSERFLTLLDNSIKAKFMNQRILVNNKYKGTQNSEILKEIKDSLAKYVYKGVDVTESEFYSLSDEFMVELEKEVNSYLDNSEFIYPSFVQKIPLSLTQKGVRVIPMIGGFLISGVLPVNPIGYRYVENGVVKSYLSTLYQNHILEPIPEAYFTGGPLQRMVREANLNTDYPLPFDWDLAYEDNEIFKEIRKRHYIKEYYSIPYPKNFDVNSKKILKKEKFMYEKILKNLINYEAFIRLSLSDIKALKKLEDEEGSLLEEIQNINQNIEYLNNLISKNVLKLNKSRVLEELQDSNKSEVKKILVSLRKNSVVNLENLIRNLENKRDTLLLKYQNKVRSFTENPKTKKYVSLLDHLCMKLYPSVTQEFVRSDTITRKMTHCLTSSIDFEGKDLTYKEDKVSRHKNNSIPPAKVYVYKDYDKDQNPIWKRAYLDNQEYPVPITDDTGMSMSFNGKPVFSQAQIPVIKMRIRSLSPWLSSRLSQIDPDGDFKSDDLPFKVLYYEGPKDEMGYLSTPSKKRGSYSNYYTELVFSDPKFPRQYVFKVGVHPTRIKKVLMEKDVPEYVSKDDKKRLKYFLMEEKRGSRLYDIEQERDRLVKVAKTSVVEEVGMVPQEIPENVVQKGAYALIEKRDLSNAVKGNYKDDVWTWKPLPVDQEKWNLELKKVKMDISKMLKQYGAQSSTFVDFRTKATHYLEKFRYNLPGEVNKRESPVVRKTKPTLSHPVHLPDGTMTYSPKYKGPKVSHHLSDEELYIQFFLNKKLIVIPSLYENLMNNPKTFKTKTDKTPFKNYYRKDINGNNISKIFTKDLLKNMNKTVKLVFPKKYQRCVDNVLDFKVTNKKTTILDAVFNTMKNKYLNYRKQKRAGNPDYQMMEVPPTRVTLISFLKAFVNTVYQVEFRNGKNVIPTRAELLREAEKTDDPRIKTELEAAAESRLKTQEFREKEWAFLDSDENPFRITVKLEDILKYMGDSFLQNVAYTFGMKTVEEVDMSSGDQYGRKITRSEYLTTQCRYIGDIKLSKFYSKYIDEEAEENNNVMDTDWDGIFFVSSDLHADVSVSNNLARRMMLFYDPTITEYLTPCFSTDVEDKKSRTNYAINENDVLDYLESDGNKKISGGDEYGIVKDYQGLVRRAMEEDEEYGGSEERRQRNTRRMTRWAIKREIDEYTSPFKKALLSLNDGKLKGSIETTAKKFNIPTNKLETYWDIVQERSEQDNVNSRKTYIEKNFHLIPSRKSPRWDFVKQDIEERFYNDTIDLDEPQTLENILSGEKRTVEIFGVSDDEPFEMEAPSETKRVVFKISDLKSIPKKKLKEWNVYQKKESGSLLELIFLNQDFNMGFIEDTISSELEEYGSEVSYLGSEPLVFYQKNLSKLKNKRRSKKKK